jgi:drug/metabolite transporter (DMT)-like permease
MRADLALALIALIWGATFVVVKRALLDVSPFLYLAIRFSLAAAVLALWFRGRIRLGFGRQEYWAGMRVGAILMLGYVLQTVGLATTSPSKSAFLTGLYIVLVPFVASLVYRVKPRILEVAGAFVAGFGMALLSISGESMSIATGDLLTLGCAAAFAVHIVLLGRWAPRFGFESLSLLQIVAAAAVAIVATPLIEEPFIRWTPAVTGAILIGGLLATALAFVLQTWAQQRTTPTRAAVIFSLEPVFAWLVSWTVEGEVLTLRAAAGAVCILGGILLVELKPAPLPEHPFI